MLISFFRLIRLKNLIIVGLAQVLIYFIFLLPIFHKNGIAPVLKGHLWMLFIIDTVIIAAAGYIINDIFDINVDQRNRGKERILASKTLSLHTAKITYAAFISLGFIISIYIGVVIGKPHLIIIYPFVTLLLYMYSRSWKQKPLLGNLVIALFSAFVPGIIWYAELQQINKLRYDDYQFVRYVLTAYLLFGFFISLSREIIKDIEDIKGDKAEGYHTMPIILGKSKAKHFAAGCLILIVLLFFWWVATHNGIISVSALLLTSVLLIFPTLFLIYKIYTGTIKNHFTQISKWLKIVMIISLIVFLCIPYL